jgi:hypothetical protein
VRHVVDGFAVLKMDFRSIWIRSLLAVWLTSSAIAHFSPIRQTNLYMNYAKIRFQSSPKLSDNNTAFVLSSEHVLAMEVKAFGQQFKALAVRDSAGKLSWLLRRLDLRPPLSKPLFVGRVTGQPNSFVFGYEDTVQSKSAKQPIHVFCGVIRVFDRVYRLVQLPNRQMIMYEQSDVSTQHFKKGFRRLLGRLGLLFFGLPDAESSSTHSPDMRQLDRIMSSFS